MERMQRPHVGGPDLLLLPQSELYGLTLHHAQSELYGLTKSSLGRFTCFSAVRPEFFTPSSLLYGLRSVLHGPLYLLQC